MAVFLVTWNLNKEGAAYSRAREALMARFDGLDNIHDPGLESVAFVSGDYSAEGLRNHLQQALDTNDRIFVTRLRPDECAWFAHTGIGGWINARIQ